MAGGSKFQKSVGGIEYGVQRSFLAHAPDAEPEKHKCLVEASKYKLFVVVSNRDQAVKECKRLVKEEGIDAVMLYPGFTHESVAQLAQVLGGTSAFLWPEGMAQAPELRWK